MGRAGGGVRGGGAVPTLWQGQGEVVGAGGLCVLCGAAADGADSLVCAIHAAQVCVRGGGGGAGKYAGEGGLGDGKREEYNNGQRDIVEKATVKVRTKQPVSEAEGKGWREGGREGERELGRERQREKGFRGRGRGGAEPGLCEKWRLGKGGRGKGKGDIH